MGLEQVTCWYNTLLWRHRIEGKALQWLETSHGSAKPAVAVIQFHLALGGVCSALACVFALQSGMLFSLLCAVHVSHPVSLTTQILLISELFVSHMTYLAERDLPKVYVRAVAGTNTTLAWIQAFVATGCAHADVACT